MVGLIIPSGSNGGDSNVVTHGEYDITVLHACQGDDFDLADGTYFDDGGPVLLCPCGSRGFVLVEDDTAQSPQ